MLSRISRQPIYKAAFSSVRHAHVKASRPQHIFCFGLGAVGKCVWDFLPKWHRLGDYQIVGVDLKDIPTSEIHPNFKHRKLSLERNNMDHVFDVELGVTDGDIVVDLLAGAETLTVMNHSLKRGARYLNTSFECWEDEPMPLLGDLHKQVLQTQKRYNPKFGVHPDPARPVPTALVEHGMNPGLISHFSIRAFKKACELSDVPFHNQYSYLTGQSSVSPAELAHRMGLRSITVTEFDEQISKNGLWKKRNDIFPNTWSVPAFWAEADADPEFYCGSQQYSWNFKKMDGVIAYDPTRKAFQTWCTSYLPHMGLYQGMLITHGECLSMGRTFSYTPAGSNSVYGPEVAFVYRPSNAVVDSLDSGVTPAGRTPYVLEPIRDQLEGIDTVGGFVQFNQGHESKVAWTWAGNTCHNYLANHNSTVIQVAAGVLSGLEYLIRYPQEGIIFPEEVRDHDLILDESIKYIKEIKDYSGEKPIEGVPATVTPTKRTM